MYDLSVQVTTFGAVLILVVNHLMLRNHCTSRIYMLLRTVLGIESTKCTCINSAHVCLLEWLSVMLPAVTLVLCII